MGVSYIDGVSVICPGGSNRILPDTEKISMDLASGIQLYLLCGRGSPSGILPGLYYCNGLCRRKTDREDGKETKEERDSRRLSSSEFRNAVGFKIYEFCNRQPE